MSHIQRRSYEIYLSAAFYCGLAISILWPGYLFIPVGGVGISPVILSRLGLVALGVGILCMDRQIFFAWQTACKSFAIPIILFSIYCAWEGLCAFRGTDPAISVKIYQHDIIVLCSALFIGSVFFNYPTIRRHFPWILSILIFVCIVIAFYEYEINDSFVSKLHLERFAAGDRSLLMVLTESKFRGGHIRAQSTFIHPLLFGQFMGASMPMVLSLLPVRKKPTLAFVLLLIMLLPVAVYLSNTRSAFLVLFASVGIYTALRVGFAQKPGAGRVAFVLVCTLALLAAPALMETVNHFAHGSTDDEVNSANGRLVMFANTFQASKDSPIFGFGDGMAPVLAGIDDALGTRTIDNYYLSLIIDVGYGGLVLFLSLIVTFSVRAISLLDTLNAVEVRRTAAFIAFTGAIMIGQYILSVPENLYYVYLFFGYFVSLAASKKTHKLQNKAVRFRRDTRLARLTR